MESTIPKYWSKDWLYEQFIENNRGVREIASEKGVNPSTIQKWLNEYGIEKYSDDEKYKDPNWLHEKYIQDGYKARRVAKMADCSKSTIRRYLREYGISKGE